MMGRKYKSVLQMINSLSSDEAFKVSATKAIKAKSIGKFLFLLRCEHKLTQKEIALKMGCTQSRVSKIESSFNENLTVKDLLDYGKALNLNLEIGYRHAAARIVDLIKYHAFKIKTYLEQLRILAKEDEAFKKRVADFHIEALFNVCKIIAESLSKFEFIQDARKKEEQQIHFSAPLETLNALRKMEDNNLIRK